MVDEISNFKDGRVVGAGMRQIAGCGGSPGNLLPSNLYKNSDSIPSWTLRNFIRNPVFRMR